jgi:hypothetical protein
VKTLTSQKTRQQKNQTRQNNLVRNLHTTIRITEATAGSRRRSFNLSPRREKAENWFFLQLC